MGFTYTTASISLISLAILSNSFLRAISSPAALTSLKRQPRVGGKNKDKIFIAPDFNNPLSVNILDGFIG
jgi:hypothetical protein